MTDDLDVIYTLWQNDNGQCAIHPEDAALVDRAMKLWADSRRDTWLSIRQPSGVEFCVLASTITSTSISTADQRRQATYLEKAMEDERNENRRSAGFIESE